MKFPKLFPKSNSSIHQLQGNVLDCSIEQIRGNKVIVNTGMRSPFVCFQDELCEPPAMVRLAYNFLCKDYDENRKARSVLSGLRSLPIYSSQQESRLIKGGDPVSQAGAPTFWEARGQSMPWIQSGEKFFDELPATSVPLRSFIPFLTKKQKLRHQITKSLIGTRPTINCQGQGFWFFLHLALMRSRRHGSNQTGFTSLKESELQQALSKVDNGVTALSQSGGYSLKLRAKTRNVLRSANKGYTSVKILGAQSRNGLLGTDGNSQNSTVDRTGTGFQSLKTETFYYGKRFVIGVEEKRSSLSGELICSAPKSLEQISKRKIIWTEMTKLCRTSEQNRMKSRSRLDGSLPGFILNSVNGGYAVAIAGYIAFLPKSLCITKKVFIGQWRQFAIISMNPKIANIVVKEIRANLPATVMRTARVQKKLRRRNIPN